MAEVKTDHHGSFRTTVTVNPASIGAASVGETTVTLPGVLTTDQVVAIPPSALEANLVVQGGCPVTAADTVRLRIGNPTAGAIDPAAATWEFIVFRR